jgi:hypothetical protein
MIHVLIIILSLLLVVVWAFCMFLMAQAKDRYPLVPFPIQRKVDNKLENWLSRFVRLFTSKTRSE